MIGALIPYMDGLQPGRRVAALVRRSGEGVVYHI